MEWTGKSSFWCRVREALTYDDAPSWKANVNSRPSIPISVTAFPMIAQFGPNFASMRFANSSRDSSGFLYDKNCGFLVAMTAPRLPSRIVPRP